MMVGSGREALVAAGANAACVEGTGAGEVLKGSKRAFVRKVQPVSIHGQLSLDVYFADPDDPEGQVSVARIGPESVPRSLEAGQTVEVHYMLGIVTGITRLP
jgi:hypothetical protein